MEGPTEGYAGPPGFGNTVSRTHLVQTFARLKPRTVALLAPPGYGKSILASQLVGAIDFDSIVWASFDGLPYSADETMQRAAGAAESAWPGRPPGVSSAEGSDAAGLVRSALQNYRGRRTCLVLDNLCLSESLGLESLVLLLQVSAHPDSALIVTSRDSQLPVSWLGHPWVLGPKDLRMSPDEADELVTLVQGDVDRDIKRSMIEASGGQAGLLSIFVRHPDLLDARAGAESVHADLREELEALALGQLTKPQALLLYAASLLRHADEHALSEVLGTEVRQLLRQVADVVPLVRLDTVHEPTLAFSVHDAATAVFTSQLFRSTLGTASDEVEKRVNEYLIEHGKLSQLFSLLLEREAVNEIPDWLDRYGGSLLGAGNLSLLSAVFGRLTTRTLLRHPKLMLLKAELMRHTGQLQDAIALATTAHDLAQHCHEEGVEIGALLLLSRLHLDLGAAELGNHYAEELLGKFAKRLPVSDRVSVHSNQAVANGILLRLDEAAMHLAEVQALIGNPGVEAEARACATAVAAAVGAAAFGSSGETAADLSLVANTPCASLATRVSALQNLGAALCETGRLARAKETLQRCMQLAREHDLNLFLGGCLATLGGVAAAEGDYAESERLVSKAIQQCVLCDDLLDRAQNLIYRAVARRAAGLADDSLDDAEAAGELLDRLDVPVFKTLADAERAASMLSMGDTVAAEETARRLHSLFDGIGARYHRLRAALVLAEISRRDGRENELDRHGDDADYIVTGNANWVCAMYIRAFPGLLGVLAAAVGPERIPSHLLRMILPENAEVALPMARDQLDDEQWRTLAVRMVGEEDVEKVGIGADIVPQCRVRLFGGLQVATSDGPVPDAAWKKRKARLLFAMLVVRKGKDVPREQLLEYLWPEMDDERARANFYVVWNNMKRALSPNLPKGEPCPYVRAAGGVCRVDDVLVTTDLDDFEQSLLEARRAETAGDAEEMLRAYGRVAEIYHGDLLPGDIYDDWFAPLRERCRQEFGDAMLRAAEMHEERGEMMVSLRMIRAALTHDAWREDLYQAALRYQIAAGQRSAAIDTYMTCMHRLSEDLGLDPSAETRRLYDQVLAMEEGPTPQPEVG